MKWHKKTEINDGVTNFHEAFAKFPKNKIKSTTKNISSIALHVQNELTTAFGRPIRYKKIGSAFEGTTIGNPLSFDLQFIISHMEQDVELIAKKNKVGYFDILNLTKPKSAGATVNNVISPQEFSEKIMFALYNLKSTCSDFADIRVTPRGTNCTALEVLKSNKVVHEICIVPALEITQKKGPIRYYMPVVEVDGATGDAKVSWLTTHAHVEKDIFIKMTDKDPRKKCLRILKAIRDQDDLLVDLRSVVIKNVVMRQREGGQWTDEKMALRVLTCLQALSDAFLTGRLRSTLEQSEDLLEDLTPEQKFTIHGRLKQLVTLEDKFVAACKPKPQSTRG